MNISQLLVAEAILLHDDAADSTTVIQRLGERLFKAGFVKDGFIDATLAREATMPTGLPLGGNFNAAIPHVDLAYVHKPALALATLSQPVIFHHMVMPEEEVPVQLVIMLALDQPKAQIEMLQEIAEVLQNADIVSRLIAAQDIKGIYSVLADLETVK